ncbi:LCP family protein [Bacillus sp. JCM 19034]|uniref:LCP family glycopolymer transferase n=1 Tax=Bacillus sp. JCM 19034 TaxID=1481928 RepID=UPI0007848473|nr:LCP family protein [Bacillus sp. JCM 19034]
MTKKKIFISIGILFGVMFLAVVAYGFYLYKSVVDTANEIHQPIERTSERRENVVDFENQDPISFLIAGVDSQGETHAGRSDTLIVMTVNPNQQSIKMLSIPRDTRTEIIGRGTIEKINHAYAYGGAAMSMDTVENFLDIPLDHYVSINMEGFKGLVDAVGGVTVENDFYFTQDGHTFNEGEIFLDGDQALAYSRMRKQDTRGDFGRNDRQRQIVEAMIHEAAHIGSITKVGEILNAVGGSVKTDLALDDMWTIQSNYRNARHNVEQMTLSGDGTHIDGLYYFIVPDDEVARVSQELRAHLELD